MRQAQAHPLPPMPVPAGDGPVPAGRLLEQALQLLAGGESMAAADLYRRVLKLQPRHAGAMLHLGICQHQIGDHRGALRQIDAALKVDPASAPAHMARGNALRELGRGAEAIEAYRRSVRLAPALANAHFNLASALEAQGEAAGALESFDQALRLAGGDPQAHFGRANVLQALGRLGEAAGAYRRAVALAPGFVDALANLGGALQQLRRYDEALAALDGALALAPQHAGALCNRGIVLLLQARHEESLAAFEAALKIDPKHPIAWHRLGQLLVRMRQSEAALHCLDRAAALAPASAAVAFDRAAALAYLGRAEEVLEASDRLLAQDPAMAGLHINRGYAQLMLGRFDEARGSLAAALQLEPQQPNANFMLGLVDLVQGDLASGLPRYEWRFRESSTQLVMRQFAAPRYTGAEDLAGRTLFVWYEQGFGDTLMFSRYVRQVAARAGRVVFEVQPALAGLMQRWLGDAVRVLPAGSPLPAFDLHCPLLSLPLACATTLASIPEAGPALACDPGRAARWRPRLRPLDGEGALRVGLAWSGSRTHGSDRYRSIELARLAPLAQPGVSFVALQTDLRDADAGALARLGAVDRFGTEIGDFDDTAALADACDLVISVDTSAVHLAAAMGKPAWLLLPRSPDWRWLLDRDDSPWYPSLRLFRQARAGDWDGVIERVAAELAARVRSGGGAGGAPAAAEGRR